MKLWLILTSKRNICSSHSIHTSSKCALTVTKVKTIVFVDCLPVALVLRVRASVQQLPLFMVSSWSWSLHKPMGIYMGNLILCTILQYMVSASFHPDHELPDVHGKPKELSINDYLAFENLCTQQKPSFCGVFVNQTVCMVAPRFPK